MSHLQTRTFILVQNIFMAISFINNSLNTISGLSPDLQSMEQIRRIMRPTDVPDTGTVFLRILITGQVLQFLQISLWFVKFSFK